MLETEPGFLDQWSITSTR